MQNTRLNNLVHLVGEQTGRTFSNPWRRVALLLIVLLFGFFLGTAVPATIGQASDWDVFAAGVSVVLIETLSWFVYARKRRVESGVFPKRFLFVDVLNAFKIGLSYGFFLEAYKLGS